LIGDKREKKMLTVIYNTGKYNKYNKKKGILEIPCKCIETFSVSKYFENNLPFD